MKLLSVILINLFTITGLPSQTIIPLPMNVPEWSQPFPSFRIVGNLYYVGTYDLASYLITTPKGNILINTGLPNSDSLIRYNIESLGFKLSDTKILLATHGHFDHVGGMAEIKQLTGAKLMIDKGDVQVLEDGGNSDFVFGGKGCTFLPAKVDRVLEDGDTIQLGGFNIVLHHHPGHTKGASSFTFTVHDEKRNYNILIANFPTILDEVKLLGMPTYKNIYDDYAKSFASLKKMKFDLWFASHANQFGLHEKYKPGDAYKPERFVDPKGYKSRIDQLEKIYHERLAKEQREKLK